MSTNFSISFRDLEYPLFPFQNLSGMKTSTIGMAEPPPFPQLSGAEVMCLSKISLIANLSSPSRKIDIRPTPIRQNIYVTLQLLVRQAAAPVGTDSFRRHLLPVEQPAALRVQIIPRHDFPEPAALPVERKGTMDQKIRRQVATGLVRLRHPAQSAVIVVAGDFQGWHRQHLQLTSQLRISRAQNDSGRQFGHGNLSHR